jgi:hypothetical protein
MSLLISCTLYIIFYRSFASFIFVHLLYGWRISILQYVVEDASIFLWVSGISYYIQYPTPSFAKWPIQAVLLSRDACHCRMCERRNWISNTISSSSHLSPLDTCITHITTSCQLLHIIFIMLKFYVERASFIDFICRRYIAQGFKDDTLSHHNITPSFTSSVAQRDPVDPHPSSSTIYHLTSSVSYCTLSVQWWKIYQAGHYSLFLHNYDMI